MTSSIITKQAEPVLAPESFVIPGLPIDNDAPEAQAPLIRNAWYVIAERDDVDRTLRSIRVLGEPLVYYRTEAGDPVVLDDRCAHRRFPLSKSRLVGDTVQCGYHGFTYEQSGRCIWAPGVKIQPKFGVRSYPAVERGPWLWVWMGDKEKADPAGIPLEEPDTWDDRYSFKGYKLNGGNYLLMIENLLDLTHIHFLHGAEAAPLEAAVEQLSSVEVTDGVGWRKTVDRDQSGLIGTWCGNDPEQITRSDFLVRQHGPSLHTASMSRVALPGEPRVRPAEFYVAHALTPVDAESTHQFYFFRLSDPLTLPVEMLKHGVENIVFEQDAEAIQYMQSAIKADRRSGTVEFGIYSDRFGIGMRRKLRELKKLEVSQA